MNLLTLGPLTFETDKATFDSLRHDFQFRWAEQPRLKRVPAQQFLGPGTMSKTIAGVIHTTRDTAGGKSPGVRSFDDLIKAAAEGTPLDLITGSGESLGRWVVRSFTNTEPSHIDNGRARKQEFSVEINYYGEDDEEGVDPAALQSFG